MKTSERGIQLIKEFEAFAPTQYVCAGGKKTIGYGHVIKEGERLLGPITLLQADELLHHDLIERERAVNELVEVPLTQGQFDALVSFAFNVGTDIDADDIAEGLGDSTLLRKLNRGDYAGAAAEFIKWNKGGGRVLNGLTRRREAERALFMEGVE